MKFGFIGTGKLAFSLGKYFVSNNLELSGYYGRTVSEAKEAAKFTGSKSYNDLLSLLKESDIIFLAVPDGQIVLVWEQLKTIALEHEQGIKSPLYEKIICHCSGVLSSKVFDEADKFCCFVYSIHPFCSINDKYHSYAELEKACFTIEGSCDYIEKMQAIFKKLGNDVFTISKEDKVKYHALAVIAGNFATGIFYMAEEMLKGCGFEDKKSHEMISKLISGNVEHIVEKGCENALTGPIERGDAGTVKKHLLTLDGDEKEIYRLMSRQLLKVAKLKNKDRDYSSIEEVLK